MAACEQMNSSEEAFDYNCTPCSRHERLKGADRFCMECGEYFCSTCLSHHEKFSVTKGHTLVKCEKVENEHASAPLSRCELHTDKEEDMVCCDHNVVCCRICITSDHSSCQNVDYLPRLAQRYKESGKQGDLEKDLKRKIQEVTIIHKEYTTQALKLTTRQTTHLKRLEAFKKSLIECVDNVVSKAEKDIKSQCGPAILNVKKDIQNYDEVLSKLAILLEDLSNEDNDIDVFKKVLECDRTMKEIRIEPRVFDEKIALDEKIQNEVVDAVASCVKDNQWFGSLKIVESGNIDVPNLYLRQDESSSTVFLTDIYSNKLRSFEEGSTKAEYFDTEGCVWGICKISRNEIALTLPVLKKVQVLTVNKYPVLKTSFFTKLHCRGIAYLDDKFYVTAGGKIMEGQGQINVFDVEGKLLGKYIEDWDGKYFTVPRSIIINSECIYITDQQNGIICLDLEGRRKWVCYNTKCKFPWGICFTPNGNLLVSGRDSNNIVIVSKDGEFLGELLNGRDGLSSPKALVMDKMTNCLVVSEGNKRYLKKFYMGCCEI